MPAGLGARGVTSLTCATSSAFSEVILFNGLQWRIPKGKAGKVSTYQKSRMFGPPSCICTRLQGDLPAWAALLGAEAQEQRLDEPFVSDFIGSC